MVPEVLKKGLYHRIASVFVQDDTGRMLLQLRGPDVKVYPNRWDQAAGGHVDKDSSYDRTAAAEVEEELGLRDVSLRPLATYRYNQQDGDHIINQFVRVYVAQVPHDIVLHREVAEVTKLQWFTPAELQAKVVQDSEAFTPGFLHELREYFPDFIA